MKPDSMSSRIFNLINNGFLAPEFIRRELGKHEEECMRKSKLTKEEFHKRKIDVYKKIKFYHYDSYKGLIGEAIKIINDPDDAPYLALAMKLKTPLWSNDKELKKQEKVIVLTTEEIVKIII